MRARTRRDGERIEGGGRRCGAAREWEGAKREETRLDEKGREEKRRGEERIEGDRREEVRRESERRGEAGREEKRREATVI